MNKKYALITLLVFSFHANSEQIVMLFGHSLAPYVIENKNSGAELQIFKEAFESQGIELIPLYTDLGRVPALFELDSIDAVQRFVSTEKPIKKGFYGDVSISYHDAFFTLEERDINIANSADLKSHQLIAFQGAVQHYSDWLTVGPFYSETNEQLTQVKLLQLGLVDIVLSDKFIFSYNLERYQQLTGSSLKPIRLHNFVKAYEYRPLFKSEQMALAFNKGLNKIKESGRYNEIIASLMKLDIAIKNEVNLLNTN